MTDQQPDLQARSPWSALNDVREVHVHPVSGPVSGEIVVPGSKSYTNRALVVAALARGTSELTGLLRSDDSYWCIDALGKLGARVDVAGDLARVHGVDGRWPTQEAQLYLGASGTNARFLPGALAASSGPGHWRVAGSRRLSERPIAPLVDALRALGGRIEYGEFPDRLPIDIEGGGLRGGTVAMSGRVSSQFISGVLMASPYAEQTVEVQVVDGIVQHQYVQITLDLMRQFGAQTASADDLQRIRIEPTGYTGRPLQLEADASTAGYFFALAALTGGRIRIRNLTRRTLQPDIGLLDLLVTMGCSVTDEGEGIEIAGPRQLSGGFTVSLKEMSDQTLTVAALAVFADGPITITDVAHIRAHESDRIHAICESLQRLGIRTEEREDGLTVYPGMPKPAVLASYDDHRVAMSLSLIGAVAGGVTVSDPGCVSKTCPTFFDELSKLGVHVEYS